MHDEGVQRLGIWKAVCDEYIVHEVSSAFDALEWIARAKLACIICVVGQTIHANHFYELVTRVSSEHARRVLFLCAPTAPDVAFLTQARADWLPLPVGETELMTLVRTVAAR